MASSSVKVYVACSSVLYLKFLVTTGIQGGKSFRSGGRSPEDSRFVSQSSVTQRFGLEPTSDEKVLKAREVELRWRRIVQNDLESIPFALAVFGGSILAGANPTVHAGAMVTYTAARCLHTYAYAHEMQPARAIFYGIGVAATLVGAGGAIKAIL